MTQDAEDWTDLTDAWKSPPPEAEASAASPGSIAAAVRRRALLARLNFYLELGTALLAGGVVIGLAVAGRITPQLAFAAVAFSAFAAGMTLWARGRRGYGDTDTPTQALETAIRQAESGLRWAVSGLAVAAASMIFMLTILIQRSNIGVLNGQTGGWVIAVLIVCTAYYGNYAVRSRRRGARYRAALDELQAD